MKSKKHAKSGAGVDFQIEGPELTRAVVVHVERKSRAEAKATDRDAQSKLAEAIGLAEAIDLDIIDTMVAPLLSPKPATFIGSGKVAEIAKRVADAEAELVVVNAQLSPVQQRNLETEWKAKVLDRTGLILEIFGRRASTKEGILQVELAHLNYQKSRLVRSWTHLERQRGGFGFIGGPGESQLEMDRRLIQERISKIKGELQTVVKTRDLHRKGRERVPFPIVALVGYTNAGKSTLFNKLTSANVLAKDLLFATLDPTMRNLTLPSGRTIILSDTVGFISELPTTLIASFRATLEEVLAADIILHVRDVSHDETEAQSHDVNLVLEELGIHEDRRSQIIEVWNKADLLDPLALGNPRSPGPAPRRLRAGVIPWMARASMSFSKKSKSAWRRKAPSMKSWSMPPMARAWPGCISAARFWRARPMPMAAPNCRSGLMPIRRGRPSQNSARP